MIEYSFADQLLNKRQGESRVVAVDGSWEKKIKTGKLVAPGANWSPDGTKLALTLWDQPTQELSVMENYLPKEKSAGLGKAEVWMMENFLPEQRGKK